MDISEAYKLLRLVDVPEGTSGDWSVERFSITEEEANHNNIMQGLRGNHRDVEAGTFTRLIRAGGTMGPDTIMSDTSAEMDDHLWFIHRATGKVLVNGLGIGVVLQALMDHPAVDHLTVVEQSADVIKLVSKHYTDRYGDKRLNIVHADALTYKLPVGAKYDAVWHDIWDNICTDNFETMSKLHRKYGRRLNSGGFQDSWVREEVLSARRQDRREMAYC